MPAFTLPLLLWVLNSSIYWSTWATSGWLSNSNVEGGSLGGFSIHGLHCLTGLFQGALLSSDLLVLVLEMATFSSNLIHSVLIATGFLLLSFLMDQPHDQGYC